jgi:hypothetical protein
MRLEGKVAVIASAEETAAMATKEGSQCLAFAADVTKEETLAAAIEAARAHWVASANRSVVARPFPIPSPGL